MMHINLDENEPNSIQSYSDKMIQINSIIYEKSLMVSREKIIPDLPLHQLADLDSQVFDLLKQFKPELLLIGHECLARPSPALLSELAQHRIGTESMSIGAACRTYNILLNEYRAVTALFILG